MAEGKRRSEQHLIDQQGEQLFRSKLPSHWVVREYRPDYGLDFTIELFREGIKHKRGSTYETLGEHVFVQLKSVKAPSSSELIVYGRQNVEKQREELDLSEEIGKLDTYRFQLETSELVTVEKMGIGVPVLLVIADLCKERCSFVCLNDYVDKILVPAHDDYRIAASRTIHIPVRNQIGSETGDVAFKWYAKRPKLLAAFQRFTYQNYELQYSKNGDWRALANYFARRISAYDFWGDIPMCAQIEDLGKALSKFRETGQPGLVGVPDRKPEGVDEEDFNLFWQQHDVFALWEQLAHLPKLYEDIWREWFLPTGLGVLTS